MLLRRKYIHFLLGGILYICPVKFKLLIVLLRSMVSLFNFCLEDLCSGERGVLKSPSIICVVVCLISGIEKDLFDVHV